MTKSFIPFTIVLFSFFLQSVSSQTLTDENSHFPMNPSPSPVFGSDIMVNDFPEEDQGLFTITSAPNGWLYGLYNYPDSTNAPYFVLLQSKDNGQTWTEFHRGWVDLYPNHIEKFSLLVNGTSASDHTLFLACVLNKGWEWSQIVARYKVEPLTFLDFTYFNNSFPKHDMAMANDQGFPAVNSNPASFGVLRSNLGTETIPKNSLYFHSYDDGGITIKKTTVIRVTGNTIDKVSLSYGRSSSQDKGQYFAAWTEKIDTNANLGHIYTAHSTPYFNSPFTAPVALDLLDPALANLCRNPVICCQVSNNDNDSTDLSELILFEKYNSATADYDLVGFYNMKGASGNTFRRIDVATGPSNQIDADITYNAADSSFLVNYYDSTNQKMVLVKKSINFPNPNAWDTISSGYNNSFPLSKNPKPRVCINQGNNKPVCAWNGKRDNGHGVSLLDAGYLTNGIDENNSQSEIQLIGISPNPCRDKISFDILMKHEAKVTITIGNQLGQVRRTMTVKVNPGVQHIQFDLTGLSPGICFYTIQSDIYNKSGIIIKRY